MNRFQLLLSNSTCAATHRRAARLAAGALPGVARARQGRAVQVHPIKPKLKPPITVLSKPRYNEPLSNFAFKFKLRRYNKVERKLARARVPKPFIGGAKGGIQDDNVFAYEPGAWAEPVKKRGAAEGGPKPFRPPGQDKRAAVPKYIPDPQDEKDKIRLDASKVLRGRTAGAYTRPLFCST